MALDCLPPPSLSPPLPFSCVSLNIYIFFLSHRFYFFKTFARTSLTTLILIEIRIKLNQFRKRVCWKEKAFENVERKGIINFYGGVCQRVLGGKG
jgi:hypothetical protein